MYFSINAPQQVTLPNGQVLSFRVNAQDSSLCELHMVGVDGNDQAGTHVLTFKRNGGPSDTQFVPVLDKDRIDGQPAYKSVDDDAVRAQDPNWDKTRETNPGGGYGASGIPRDRGVGEGQRDPQWDQTSPPINTTPANPGKVNTSGQFHQSPTGAPVPDRGYETPAAGNPRQPVVR